MLITKPSIRQDALLYSTRTDEETISDLRGEDKSVESSSMTDINSNGKRPLQEDSPLQSSKKIFYSNEDVSNLRRSFEACKYQQMQMVNCSKINVNPGLLYSGIVPYEKLRDQSYHRLTEMCFISDKNVEPNKASFLSNLKKELIKNIIEKNGNPTAFAAVLKSYFDQLQRDNLLDGSPDSYLQAIKKVFVKDEQNLYQGEAAKVFAKMCVDQAIADSPFLGALKEEVNVWLDKKRFDKSVFYEQFYLYAARKDTEFSLDLSDPINTFGFYRKLFTNIVLKPEINLDAEFVEICRNILISDIRPPEGKTEYLFQIQQAFINDPLNLYEGNAICFFVEMVVDETIASNRFLNSIKQQVDLWLEANEVCSTLFSEQLYLHAAKKNAEGTVNLYDPRMIFKFFQTVFTTMQIETEKMEGEVEENSKVDLEAEFFGFCCDTLVTLSLPEGIGQDKLKTLFDKSYQKLMFGSNHLRDKYELLINEFFGDLDIVMADVETTAQLIEKNDHSRDLISLQALELLEIRNKFINLLTTLNDDLTQFHVQRSRQSLISRARSEFVNSQATRGVANFPYLCTENTLELSREEPGSNVIINLLNRYYSVYDAIHEDNMLYLRKTISVVNQAKLSLEQVIKKYNLLLFGKNEDSYNRTHSDIKV